MAKKVKNTAILFTAGEIYDYSKIKFRVDDYTVAVDSGYYHCQNLGIKPNILIGDFDSIGKIPKGFNVISLPTAKDYTDLSYAIEHVLDTNPDEIVIFGGLGGRFDHTLSNLQIAVNVAQYCSVKMFDGITTVNIYDTASRPGFILKEQPDHYFSVISHTNISQNVNIKDGLYPLNNYTLTNTDPRAISNEFKDSDVLITADSGVLLIITEQKR